MHLEVGIISPSRRILPQAILLVPPGTSHQLLLGARHSLHGFYDNSLRKTEAVSCHEALPIASPFTHHDPPVVLL